nr:penicillin-binding transpeptidase domain-containing protein [Delftia acidovorans]
MTARITRHPVPVDGWTVHGKTGTGSPGSDNRYDASRAYGWYVGWATRGERRLAFATLIQDEQAQKPMPACAHAMPAAAIACRGPLTMHGRFPFRTSPTYLPHISRTSPAYLPHKSDRPTPDEDH